MTEREVVRMVWEREQFDRYTDLGDDRWNEMDSIALQTCYDKGFLRWKDDKLVVTPLGKRSCGGLR
jgi:hypothetical protein